MVIFHSYVSLPEGKTGNSTGKNITNLLFHRTLTSQMILTGTPIIDDPNWLAQEKREPRLFG
jgi:hypothetical protein